MTEAPAAPEATPQSPAADPVAPAGPPEGDKGFPDGTPLTEMTDAQKAAYWQHYARKHEDTVKGFKGLTPQQVADLQSKVETLETEKMSADEKTLKAVRDEAAKQAKAEAEAEYLPQIRAAKVQSIASQIVQGDKLSAFMDIVDTTRLLGEDGQVDESKVMGYLTAMYGTTPPAGPRWQNFGQHSPPPPPQRAGAGGAAEAQKRFGKKT
jgi:hypothetical protein